MSHKENIPQIGDPRFCDIVIATRCVLRCKMCKAWQCGAMPNEISFEDAKKFVTSLAGFVKFPLEINVMGGEPFLKEWCLDLCDFIGEQGFKSIISTNACLIDEAMAKKIAASKLDVLAISLESLKAKTHDFYRGVEGTFAKVMDAVRYLEKYKRDSMSMTILTIIMEKNLDDIVELVEWVNKNKLFVNISFLALLETGIVHPRENWFKRPEYAQMWPQDVNKAHRLIDELIRLRRKGCKIWNPVSQLEAFKEYYTEPDKFMRETEYRVHDYIIDLDENGTIYLSGEPLGNIREGDVKQFWFSEKANEIREKIDRQGPGKRCCVINFVCAFPSSDEEYLKKKEGCKGDNRAHVQGFLFLNKGDIENAVNEFTRIIQSKPFDVEAHHGLGLCYQRGRKFEDAITEFKTALEMAPENIDILQDMGFCYKDMRQFENSASLFKKALEVNPDNHHAYVGLGFCYLESKKISEAAKEFNRAIELEYSNINARHGLGLCYKYSSQLDRAEDEFKKISDIAPADERGHLELGFLYLHDRRVEKAIEEFMRAVKLNPNNGSVHNGLSLCYMYQRKFDKAISELEKAAKIIPDDEYIHQSLGFYYKDLNQFAKAQAEFAKVLEINPHSLHGRLGLGFCYFEQREIEKAVVEFNQIISIDPGNEHAYHGLGLCYQRRKDFNRAVEHFKQGLDRNLNNEYLHYDLAFCYLAQGLVDNAIFEFNSALKLAPQNERIHQGLAMCYQRIGQFDKAIDEFIKALNIAPNNEHIHQGLGFCYKDFKEYGKAMDEFQKVRKINPKNPHSYLGAGFCYLEQNQIEQASEAFNSALCLCPDLAHAHYGLGLCNQRNQNFDKAIEEFKKGIEIEPDNLNFHKDLAYCYETNRQFDKAITEFTRLLESEPNNEEYHHGLGCCYEALNMFNHAMLEFKTALKIKPDHLYASKCLESCNKALNKKPKFCVIEVSHNCMFKCRMCNYWQVKDGQGEIEMGDLYKFISKLKDFAGSPFEMNISGGETLMKKGILELIEFIADKGFRFSLVTNGYLIDKPTARRIAYSGLNFLAISLDSLDEGIHDDMRGVKGACRKVLEAVEYFSSDRGRLQNITIQSIIMGPNLHGLVDLVNWAHSKDVSLSFMAVTRPNMIPMDSAWYKKPEFKFLWPQDTAKVRLAIDELIAFKKRGYRIDNPVGQLERFKQYFLDPEKFVRETPCSLGVDILHVNNRGDIYLCCEMDPIGNIKENSLDFMWNSEGAQFIREKILSCKRNCAEMVNCYREVL